MIVSYKHRFVLLAPWKTASSTAHLRLQAFNESPYNRFFDFNPRLQRVVHQHITYPEFAALPESHLGYFVGAFVRNPYDRVYSGFLQLQRDFLQHPRVAFTRPWIKTLVMRQVAENYAQLAAAEFDFDKWVALLEEHQIYEIGRNSSFPLHPAHYWTGIEGEQKVDFVGRAEDFESYFASFCSMVRIEAGETANANVTERVNETGQDRPRYTSRMSSASISKINTLFAQDFDLFGYDRV